MRGLISVLTFAACLASPALAFAQDAPAAPDLAAEPAPAAVSANDTVVPDPWERMNRNLYGIHDGIDHAVLEPVARGYRAITPHFFRTGVSNFLHNLRSPVIFANDVLQGRFRRAGVTAARFGVNSTVGLAGVFDPAQHIGLERHDEDFGQTLAVWGVHSGPYLFIPVIGPTTVRDGIGSIVDLALDPLNYWDGDDADTVRVSRAVVTGLSAREEVLDTVDNIRATSVDPYVTIRTSYGLLRQSAIQNGPANVQDLPEFENIDEQPASEAPADGDAPEQHNGENQAPG
jgi:phospholipid-binding lipoprotein MlaA